MFHYNENSVKISPERLNEIHEYLANGESSHICHTTNKTCYGALEYQSEIFNRLGLIPEPTVECLLTTAERILKTNNNERSESIS
jgi:hypothetical protein